MYSLDVPSLPACPDCEARLQWTDRGGYQHCGECDQPASLDQVVTWLRPIGPRPAFAAETSPTAGDSKGLISLVSPQAVAVDANH